MSSLIEYQQPACTWASAALVLGVSSSLLVSGIQLGAIHTVPLLYTLPVDTSTQLFSKVHRGSAKTSAPIAAFSATAFAVSAYLFAGGEARFNIVLAHAAGLILSSLLWTRLAMKGVTRALLDNTSNQVKLADEMDQATMKRLLRKWKWMSLFKGGLTFGGGLIGLIALAARTT
jgi:hypothetical protein